MLSVIKLGFDEEEVMKEDSCGTMFPEEEEGFRSKSARTSEEEILPSTFSKQEQMGTGANGKRRSVRRNRNRK